ncbi:hypothetical protein GCM10007079_38410 [Nocardiopsis terrae]|nr:hypothetical protein GCM10007079_38410 [Nocardiopsis terrae]
MGDVSRAEGPFGGLGDMRSQYSVDTTGAFGTEARHVVGCLLIVTDLVDRINGSFGGGVEPLENMTITDRTL